MNYNELFINKDDVLLIRKTLVKVLGNLNEAVVLNQIHYWLEINKKADKNFRDGRYWIFNTYQSWKETDFDFWSVDTIRRTITSLEKKGIVITANYNKMKIDKTKWYSIDYEKLQSLVDNYDMADCVHDMANCTDGHSNLSKAIPETTTENTYKDYIEDNTSSNDDGKVNTSFSENDEKPKLTKSELQKKQKDMSKRFYDICDVSIGHCDLKEAVNNAFNLYLDLFTEKTGKIHPILRDETLIDVCSALSHINDKEFNHFEEFDFSKPKEDGTMPLEEMVRLHFARSHNGKTDYSIAHFCNKNYLLKLAQLVMS